MEAATRIQPGPKIPTWAAPISAVRHAIFLSTVLRLLRPSSELPSSHPLRRDVEEVNAGGPYVGLVTAYSTEEAALFSSGAFVPRSDIPFLDLSGRRFHIGTIRGVNVIYVMSGQRRLNAGITVQILIDVFEMAGIVHYGIAGSSDDSLFFGDVSIPLSVASTGSWTWTKFNSEGGDLPGLKFGTYNIPAEGKNLLGRVEFKLEELYSVGRAMEEVFWLQPTPSWYQLALKLQDLPLERCANESVCLPVTPRVVQGLKASTADMFVDNAAYRDFLRRTFGVFTVDEESAAVLMATKSSEVPCIVFRGVSDLAGSRTGWSSTSLYSLAASNALTVAVEFIALLPQQTPQTPLLSDSIQYSKPNSSNRHFIDLREKKQIER